MARLISSKTGRRVLVLTIAAVAAVLNAKGISPVHVDGFFDGPH